jgi:hypothetical protein
MRLLQEHFSDLFSIWYMDWLLYCLKNSVFWDIMLYSLKKVNWHFKGTYHLHLHGWRWATQDTSKNQLYHRRQNSLYPPLWQPHDFVCSVAYIGAPYSVSRHTLWYITLCDMLPSKIPLVISLYNYRTVYYSCICFIHGVQKHFILSWQ